MRYADVSNGAAIAHIPNSVVVKTICIFAVIYWLQFLDRTQSFYVPYLVTGGVAIALCVTGGGIRNRVTPKKCILLGLLTSFLASLTIVGNYSILFDPSIQGRFARLVDVIRFILFLLSSLITYGIISFYGYDFFLKSVSNREGEQRCDSPTVNKAHVRAFFIFSWLFISAVYLAFLFLAYYPGVLTPDSVSQVSQIMSGNYSNHHPFWHTQVIRLATSVGFMLFGDINAAVATFSTLQCIVMAAIFSFTVSTMMQMGAKRWLLFLLVGLFAFLPYHWAYASTMWKDVLFGGVVLLFICCLYRLRKNIGNRSVSAVLLFISSMGFCLFRSNGLIAFILLFIVVCIIGMCRKGDSFPNIRIISIEMGAAIVISLVMLGPVINALSVVPVDRIESLSIPAQQIARVVKNDRDLTADEASTLDKVIDRSKIAGSYTPWLSDPIKNLVREHKGNDVINENPKECIQLYLSLGLKYPKDYFLAWVDQTKGYWNSGYPYWSTTNSVYKNELGIQSAPASQKALNIAKFIDGLSNNKQGMIGIIYSTGFWVQVLICLMVFNALSRRIDFIEPLAIICIVGTLLIATPVFAEFRYIYSLYTCLPFVLYTLTRKNMPKIT